MHENINAMIKLKVLKELILHVLLVLLIQMNLTLKMISSLIQEDDDLGTYSGNCTNSALSEYSIYGQ